MMLPIGHNRLKTRDTEGYKYMLDFKINFDLFFFIIVI